MATLTTRQIGSVGIALLGLYLLGRSLVYVGPAFAFLFVSAGESDQAPDIWRLVALSAVGIAITALPGALLVAFRDRLSHALFGEREASCPEPGETGESREPGESRESGDQLIRHVQVAALSVLGVLFVVLGAANVADALARAEFLGLAGVRRAFPWDGALQVVFGLGLFFGARGLARIWAAVRGTS